MPIVTLTTDFGHKDYSVSVIKGALIQQISNVRIIDISHEISPYNPSETAYILKNAFQSFPKGSIHIIGVESEWTPENSHLVMEFQEHYYSIFHMPHSLGNYTQTGNDILQIAGFAPLSNFEILHISKIIFKVLFPYIHVTDHDHNNLNHTCEE